MISMIRLSSSRRRRGVRAGNPLAGSVSELSAQTPMTLMGAGAEVFAGNLDAETRPLMEPEPSSLNH